jgi:DSF synthase
MYKLGLVHILAEPGEGEAVVADYIRRNSKRQTGHLGIYRASREINPISRAELERVVEIWAATALSLRPHDVKVMRRLAEAQVKLFAERLGSASV